jgi:hypothetical protein
LKYRLLPSVQFCDELAAFHAAETDFHQLLHVRLVAEIVANNEELQVKSSFKFLIPIIQRAASACKQNCVCAYWALWCCSSGFLASGWADMRIIPLSFLSLIVDADALLSNG